MMTIQLLGKDDSRIDDSEMLVERWQAYVDSFVSVRAHKTVLKSCSSVLQSPTTDGVPQARISRPFLRKYVYPTKSLHLFLSLLPQEHPRLSHDQYTCRARAWCAGDEDMHPDIPLVLRVGHGGLFVAYSIERGCNRCYGGIGEHKETGVAREDAGGGVV
jgi:hypothetical protein